MEKRKYRSPLGGDKTSDNRWIGPKGQAALALAVSLWIAGMSSVEANCHVYIDGDDANHPIKHTDNTNNNAEVAYPLSVPEPTKNAEATTLTVTGDWSTVTTGKAWEFTGGRSSGDVNNYTLILDGAKVFAAFGGKTTGNGSASNNHVILKNHSSLALNVIGGQGSQYGNADYNTVEIIDSDVTNEVTGGHAYNSSSANYNTVSLTNSTVGGTVRGGYHDSGAGNIVMGNTLNLNGANTVSRFTNFQTVNIQSAKWGTPALTQTGTGTVQNADGSWATIDTRGITFTGVDALNAGQKTILIKNKMTGFGGTILSGKYKVGTTLEGLGTASISDADLIYTIDKGTKMEAQEQTHNTLMASTASMTALSMGDDFIGAATDGLSDGSNTGADGVSTFAQMGGGSMRQETGSHVTSHLWNAILALGHQNEKKSGTTEYGAFFEYGTGNYSTFNGDIRGDGSMHYTGGGFLGKWTSPKKDYFEGSIRLGRINDDATNVLTDDAGNAYGYNTKANYYGLHVGYGKIFDYSGGRSLDVYGKFFYNHRNGVSFDAGGHYDLDAINSQILRLGARYSMKTSDQWKWYSGLAYEYEFGGEATGTADGVAIRGASTKGGSLRAEVGATITQADSPWTVDLNLTAFAGKKRGLTGGVGLKYNF